MALLDGIDTTPPGQAKTGDGLLSGIDTTPPEPGWASRAIGAAGSWATENLPAAGKLLERTGIHLAAAPADLTVMGAGAIGKGAEKLGYQFAPIPTLYDVNGQQLTGPGAAAQPLPSAAAINAASAQIDPSAGTAMKVADFVLPFLASGGRSAASRIGEAEGVVNKAAEGVGYLTGAGVDAALSAGGSELGEKYIGGPEGAFIGSLFGGGIRPTAQRGFGWLGQKTLASPEAPDIFDAMASQQGPRVLPTFGQVTGTSGKQLEKAVGSVPILRSGGNAARNAAEAGIASSRAAGLGELADTAPIPGPVSPDITASRIIDQARAENLRLGEANAAEQQALENQIGTDRPTVVSPVVSTMSQLTDPRTAAAPVIRTIEPRLQDLSTAIEAQPPSGWFPTVPYGIVKDLRTDIGARSKSADPVPGRYQGLVREPYTDVMRTAAEEAGQGAQFDIANANYAKFMNEQKPWLERQGGSLEQGAPPVSPATIAGRATGITGPSPGYLTDIATHLGPEAARSTLADVLSRQGEIKGQFTPSRWGSDYAAVNAPTKAFIAQNAPAAVPYLENAATGGRAFDLAPERPGMSNAAGFLGALAAALAKAPKAGVALAGGLETPSVIRALAGRTDIPAIVAQYAIRQGLLAGQR